MTSFTFHTPENSQGDTKDILNKVQTKYGFIPSLFNYMAEAPYTIDAYAYMKGLLDKSDFSDGQKQVALFAVIHYHDCNFCTTAQRAFGKMHNNVKNGLPTDLIKFLDCPMQIKDLFITPIKTSHDSAEPYGFIFESNGKKVVHITDTGYLPNTMFDSIRDADVYFFESNYDPELLLESRRPHFLKQRIFSNK
mgnify:CR=1 FL=1